jgi:hypothetical protein
MSAHGIIGLQPEGQGMGGYGPSGLALAVAIAGGRVRVFTVADSAIGDERWALPNLIPARATGKLGTPAVKLVQSAR